MAKLIVLKNKKTGSNTTDKLPTKYWLYHYPLFGGGARCPFVWLMLAHRPYCMVLYLGACSQTLFLKKQKNTEPECYRINRFTDRERKEIFDDWRKHIKSIPTQEQIDIKNRIKKHRVKMLQNR